MWDGGAASDAAVAAAERLYEAGEAKWCTSEDVFIEILADTSPAQV